jgi:DNA-binding response OmpR family regulator
MTRRRRILLVWDDAAAAAQVAATLIAADYEVRVETDSFAGLLWAEMWSPGLILLNWEQPLVMGAVFRAALAAGTGMGTIPPVIALTTEQHAAEAGASGARAVLTKPTNGGQVVQWANRLVSLAERMLPANTQRVAAHGRS